MSRLVDRDGEAEPDVAGWCCRAQGQDRGVDPDHPGAGIDQRAAGVARVDRRVGLDGVDVRGRRVRVVARSPPPAGCRAETMPWVTVPGSPSGEPTAITGSPT